MTYYSWIKTKKHAQDACEKIKTWQGKTSKKHAIKWVMKNQNRKEYKEFFFREFHGQGEFDQGFFETEYFTERWEIFMIAKYLEVHGENYEKYNLDIAM